MLRGRRRFQPRNPSGCLSKRIPQITVTVADVDTTTTPAQTSTHPFVSDEIPECTLPSRSELELSPLDVVHVDMLSNDVEQVSSVSREELEVPRI